MQPTDTESNLGKSKLRLALYLHSNDNSEVWHLLYYTKFGVKQFYIPFPFAPLVIQSHRYPLLFLSLHLTNDNDNQQNGEPSSPIQDGITPQPIRRIDRW
jgi:hypothetical protein